MDRIILGDNQFFGVSHMSEERGIERAIRFQDDRAILDVVDAAYDAGIHAVSFSTHDRVGALCDYFKANKGKYGDLRFYVTIPYAYKYADLVNERGIVGAVRDVLFKNSSPAQVARMASNFGAVILKQDPKDLMRVLIDAELTMFTRLNLEVVFLQNIIADLILGLGWNELFRDFSDYVVSKYQVRAGFITTNLPRMVNALLDAGIERPLSMLSHQYGRCANEPGYRIIQEVSTRK